MRIQYVMSRPTPPRTVTCPLNILKVRQHGFQDVNLRNNRSLNILLITTLREAMFQLILTFNLLLLM